MNRYVKYNIRWQAGFIVCYPCMWFFQDKLQWGTAASVIAFQFVGANIFYWVDDWIFKAKPKTPSDDPCVIDDISGNVAKQPKPAAGYEDHSK
jgi:hypothetical protein